MRVRLSAQCGTTAVCVVELRLRRHCTQPKTDTTMNMVWLPMWSCAKQQAPLAPRG